MTDARFVRPPPPVGEFLVLLAIVIVIVLNSAGCGAGAIGTQADMVAFGGIALAEADQVLVTARAADLDGIVDAARADCADGDCDREAYRARLAAEEARWEPAMACRAPAVEALRAWLDGLDTASRASENVAALLMARLAARFTVAYSVLAQCVDAVQGPSIPDLLPPLRPEAP
jgi:hypothetical protein